MNKKLLRKKLALMLATLKKKRPYYCELEFLESTGTQYIDTGIKYNINKTYQIKNKMVYTATQAKSQGSGWDAGGQNSILNSGDIIVGSTGVTTNVIGKVVELTQTINSGSGTLSVYNYMIDGISFPEASRTHPSLSQYAGGGGYGIFAIYSISSYTYFCKAKCYKYKILEDNVLIRDFIPVLDWDMTPCMYDRVTEQLFYNQATSGNDFSYGREIHPVEYLESTGTQYIDTGYSPNNTSGIYAKIRYTNTTSADYVAVGTWLSNNRFVAPFRGASNGSWFSGWGASEPSSGVTGDALDTDIHEIFLNYNNSRSISVDNTSLRTDISSISGNWKPIYLFARNLDGVLSGQMVGRIYNVQITEGTVLVHDYIPAIDSEGRGFMFDRVTHTIYDNAGQGQFSYPARELEYIKNNGSNTYLSLTGFYPTPDWDIECEVMGKTWGFTSGFNSLNIMGCGSSASTDSYTLTIAQGDVGATTPTCRRGGAGVRKIGCDLDVKYKIISTETSVTWNGEAGTFLSQPTGSTATTNPITLFRNPLSSAYGTMNIYSFVVKSHQTGNKILDLVPVLMNGSAGMLDKVNNVMYTNQGTGSWTLGKIVEPEYE